MLAPALGEFKRSLRVVRGAVPRDHHHVAEHDATAEREQ